MYRVDKLNRQIQRIISKVIQEEVDNPNLGMVSIVRVKTSSDLRYCKVFFSVFPEENLGLAEEVLGSMKNFIKKLLSKNLHIKFLPDIEFVSDSSIKYSVNIYEKIEELRDEFKEDNRDNKE